MTVNFTKKIFGVLANSFLQGRCDKGSPLNTIRCLSAQFKEKKQSYKIVIVGGGTAGCTMANKLKNLTKDQLAVIEPSEFHYYRPMWTLVGAGIKDISQSYKTTSKILPKNCTWIKDWVITFDPDNNIIYTSSGNQIRYDYLIVGMGLQLNWHQVTGLHAALNADPMVVSNYSPKTVTKTFGALERFNGGTAIFTHPSTSITCTGAPQKAVYLTDHYLRKTRKRNKSVISFHTASPVLFSVDKYHHLFRNIMTDRNIQVNYNRNLVAIRHESKEVDFMEMLNCQPTGKIQTCHYDFLHVTPPMSAPDVLHHSPLADETGYLNVNSQTLQHNIYNNVFGIGDCICVPASKTAAAIACQSRALNINIHEALGGNPVKPLYDGYTCCAVVTAYGKAILAEFSAFDMQPRETFPMRAKESRLVYFFKKYLLPKIYWHLLLRGIYEGIPGKNGPESRKCIQ